MTAETRDSLLDQIDGILGVGDVGDAELQRVADLLAEEVGDASAIARFDEGRLLPVAFGHADPEVAELLRRSYPPSLLERSRMAQLVLGTDEAVLIPRIDPREFRSLSGTPYAEERGVYSIAMAGIRREHGEPAIGVVSISREHPGAPYGEEERDLIAAVARRLADAF